MTTSTDRPGGTAPPPEEDTAGERWDQPSGRWMLPGNCPDTRERTLVLEAAARLLFPTVLVFSVFLLFEGHYGPGGGFSGGLVAGLAFVLRYIAGGDDDPGSTLRIRPPVVVGTGLTIAVLTGLAPLLWGGAVLSSAKWRISFGDAGYIDVVTSLLLDVGVYLLIIGVVLDLLRSLGSGIARDAREAGEAGEAAPRGSGGGDR
ncbi:Na(+) H(+) antiporter subunit A / Na(+) H(+) antiporter subunit B [Pseudonocardia sp. Ae168_Ps1]|uniref:MnhB domain-containing protein n=1 Tax=unclassified Pseudonocardia TaxID=2619320 RepID=UPI00095994EE|nr:MULTISPECIES: MnhB domain-containing protein [unclassified Pseudonocardia]OLL76381.1 Na(+) H(+) antiporter subunit A / Na(+) H(+) antiporter subunit B [Pseudonocardia sp. Ae150A_Ps1]OLL82391.1 Na(+) H(+) antiporter subunit A / Na(+) H(+) antiporter subunit B [Pseudonocardia sp. Ae168_Ps1]OLL83494.1 Na(+) H(+) antiporter subunit A / Na(+) H(+) antiporter subunit B [Pseudonocardia sp. Ae263_Ps1]